MSCTVNNDFRINYLKKLKLKNPIFFQPSQFPGLNTDVSWDTQLSSDYVENSGKLKIGSRAYNIEQVFSSQANDLMQELLFKLAVTDAINDLQYKVDFLHKVQLHVFIKNKIDVKTKSHIPSRNNDKNFGMVSFIQKEFIKKLGQFYPLNNSCTSSPGDGD